MKNYVLFHLYSYQVALTKVKEKKNQHMHLRKRILRMNGRFLLDMRLLFLDDFQVPFSSNTREVDWHFTIEVFNLGNDLFKALLKHGIVYIL